MIGKIPIILNCIEKELLLERAQSIVIWLVGTVDDLVAVSEISVWAQCGAMQSEFASLRVGRHIVAGGIPILHARDTHAPIRPNDVLYEVGHLAHHRPPTGLVPADRTVIKSHLQLTVIVHAWVEFAGEPRPDGADSHRFGPCHLAHHVNVVHAAINNRRHGVHE